VGGVAVVIEQEVGMAAFAIQPALDLSAVLFEPGSDCMFRGVPIGPGGGGGDVALVTKAFAKLIIGASDMLAEGMASGRFILRQIAGVA
jgi:hypothetical protein